MQKNGCVCVWGVSKFNSVAAGLFSGLDHWASRAWVIEGGGAFLTPFSFAVMDQPPSRGRFIGYLVLSPILPTSTPTAP